MIPWDFGIIQAIKDQLGMAIFPSTPPKSLNENPHVIFELKDILQGKNFLYRVGFTLTLVDNNEGSNLEILKKITKIIRKELTLQQGEFEIGSAKIKIESVESKRDKLIINLAALLQLKTIYEDEDGDDDE
ncbi:MAG: hypothetical protein IJT36_06965 [Alphaproteobacteria bacterium]|nr:hypothetical protein [Alphaproteobacteria bacterium]